MILILASGASPPSDLNGLFFYICIYVCDGQCTYHNVICASNFACALSRSPTMRSIQLVFGVNTVMFSKRV